MKLNLIVTVIVSSVISAIITTLIILNIVPNVSNQEVSGDGGYFNISNSSTATITGYEWLQLNNKSDNKIQLSNGKIHISSPSLIWNGETVATREWVESICEMK